ncbi:MAG: hypothetical protein F4X77_10750 [Acidobacteriia bacterium]|nr:hypothetical protein [Terriglobia bacterium]
MEANDPLCHSLGHGVGLDLDRPGSSLLGEGATNGAEADLEVQYVPSPKLGLALSLQQRGKSG